MPVKATRLEIRSTLNATHSATAANVTKPILSNIVRIEYFKHYYWHNHITAISHCPSHIGMPNVRLWSTLFYHKHRKLCTMHIATWKLPLPLIDRYRPFENFQYSESNDIPRSKSQPIHWTLKKQQGTMTPEILQFEHRYIIQRFGPKTI